MYDLNYQAFLTCIMQFVFLLHSHCVAINVGSVTKRCVIVHPLMYSGCADVYIWLSKQANGMLGFSDDLNVLNLYARLMIMMMIMMFKVSYASHLTGVSSAHKRIPKGLARHLFFSRKALNLHKCRQFTTPTCFYLTQCDCHIEFAILL